jgi:hypothetical protein
MTVDSVCLAAGPLISWVVELGKRIPWVAQYPRQAAFVLAFVVPVLRQLGIGGAAGTVRDVAVCVLVQLGLAVGTHEVLTDPIRARVVLGSGGGS